jgi:hypothetical protein
MEAEVFWISEVKISESEAERKCMDRTISFMVL